MKLTSSLFGVLFWLSAFAANSQTLIKTISDPVNDGVNTIQGYNFEMISIDVILNPDNSVRFIIDSYGKLAGINTSKALNNSIMYGDLKLQTSSQQYGINFVSNDSGVTTGLYATEDWLALGQQNYGLDKVTLTNLSQDTANFLSAVDIVEIQNGGKYGSNRTIITVPAGLLTNGYYDLSLAFECVNDLIKGDFNLKLNEFEKEIVLEHEIIWEYSGPDGGLPELPSSGSAIAYAAGGGVVLLAIILLLMGGGSADQASGPSNPTGPVGPNNPNNPNNKKEVNESSSSWLIFTILALFLFQTKKIKFL